MHALPPVVEDAVTALHETGYRSTAIELEALFNEPQSVASSVPNTTDYIMQAPVLSTAHISQATNDELLRLAQDNPFVINMPGGFLIFVEDGVNCDEFPDDVRELAQWCVDKNYQWFRLDCDGDEIPDLPTFDW